MDFYGGRGREFFRGFFFGQVATDVSGLHPCAERFGDRRGLLHRPARNAAFDEMSGSRAVYYPTNFFWGLAATVAVLAGAAFIYGGGEWALGAFAGAAAVAADFVFVAAFSVSWLEAGRRGGKRLVLRGVSALAAKVLIPPAAVCAALWSGTVNVYAVAFSALTVALAAPFLLVIYLFRQTSNGRSVP
jgi:hypothetical protein